MSKENVFCQICQKQFNHLGSHVYHSHGITAREYKERFGLPYKFSLISDAVKIKKQAAFEERREYYIKASEKTRQKYKFKKDDPRTKKRRRSEYEVERNKEVIKKVNETSHGVCAICNKNFKHLKSHVYNKHGFKL